MGTTAPAAERIAAFAAEAPPAGADALAVSRRAVLDTAACMWLGVGHETARAALAAVAGWSGGAAPVPVCGTAHRLAPPWAALVNATAAHANNFDDWEAPGLTHVSAVTVPALLSAAPPDAPGPMLLDAHRVAVEIAMRIGDAVNPEHYALGWISTATVAVLAAAAACSRIRGLDAARTAAALAAASSMTGGYRCHIGTPQKPLHAGLAAKSAVLATALAEAGLTGNTAALDAEPGFLSLMTAARPEALHASLDRLGAPWTDDHAGLYFKPYPACGGCETVIEAALALRAGAAPDPGAVEEVTVWVSAIARSVCPYGVPETADETRFSVPWWTAAALVDGRVGTETFSDAALGREDVRALAARVRVETHPVGPGLYFDPDNPDRVSVRLADGTVAEHAVAVPLGAPSRPPSAAMLEDKLRDCARGRVPDDRVGQVLALVQRADDGWTVSNLGTLLAAP